MTEEKCILFHTYNVYFPDTIDPNFDAVDSANLITLRFSSTATGSFKDSSMGNRTIFSTDEKK
jgi:hypothetical protein